MDHFSLIINGKAASTTEHFEVLNPSTGAVVGRAPKASLAQLDDAVDAAEIAFRPWSKRPDAERKALYHAVGEKIGDNAEELARLLTMEQGKPFGQLPGWTLRIEQFSAEA